MRALPLLTILFLGLACADEPPPKAVARTPDSGNQAESVTSASSGPRKVGVKGRLPATADQLVAARVEVEARAAAAGKRLTIEVTAPLGMARGTVPRLILLDPKKVAAGFDETNRAAQPWWSWNVAEVFGEELPVRDDWAFEEGKATVVVEVPRPSRGSRVLALFGDCVALGAVPSARSKALGIEVKKPFEVIHDVLVSRAGGEAAQGVEVVSMKHFVGSIGAPTPASSRRARRTDEGGRASLAVLPKGNIAARLIGGQPVESDRGDPWQITLPEVATVRVRMQFPDGVSVDGASATIRLTSPGKSDREYGALDAPEGVASFFPVRVSTSLRAVASVIGWQGSTLFETPPEDGGELDVVVTMTKVPDVRFTALSSSGQPIAGTSFGVRIGGVDQAENIARSGRDGEVLCRLPGFSLDAPLERIFVREVVDTKDRNDGRVAMVVLDPPGAGAVDLGAVTLLAVPTAVSGRVVNAKGRGMGNVRVHVEDVKSPDRFHGRVALDSAFPGSGELAKTKTERSGAFRIRMGLPDASLDRGSFQLRAEKMSFSTLDPVRFELGQEDLEVRVQGMSKLLIDTSAYHSESLGSVLKGVHGTVHLTLRAGRNRGSSHSVSMGRKQSISRLIPGSYSLYLGDKVHTNVLLVGGIMLRPGQTLEDPRLNPLDLSPVFEHRTMTVRCATGPAPESVLFGYQTRDGAMSFMNVSVREGLVDLPVWTQLEPSTYLLRAQGFRPMELPRVVDGGVILFEEGIAVTLQLEGWELPGVPFNLLVRQAPNGEASSRAVRGANPSYRARFDADGRATLKASKPGTYTLRASQGWVDEAEVWIDTEFMVPDESGKVLVIRRGD